MLKGGRIQTLPSLNETQGYLTREIVHRCSSQFRSMTAKLLYIHLTRPIALFIK
jgi:hypothetical protein